jgi:hypothetical protein
MENAYKHLTRMHLGECEDVECMQLIQVGFPLNTVINLWVL